ncbi:phytanoyl-CoA dioxygenase family protein [Curvivirga aplysinae]|uniref:hypothetical protein n=1 Tax=Curvivirga aplysinae TaxID=2529852 RepID=UPI0012BB65EA|nr:hypothetical protein [Curvivirga aplysinae]MTI09022.1 hypothetical protein [Curvivirga aplysinae]
MDTECLAQRQDISSMIYLDTLLFEQITSEFKKLMSKGAMTSSLNVTYDWFIKFHEYIQNDDRWEVMRNIVPISVQDIKDDPDRITEEHQKAIGTIQKSLNGRVRDYVTLCFRSFIKEALGIPTNFIHDPTLLEEIKEIGFTKLPDLQDEQLNKIDNFLRSQTIYGGDNQEDLTPITLDDAKAHHLGHIQTEDLINSIDVLYAGTDPVFLSIAENYMNHPVIITNIQSWWSFPGHKEAKNAQFFHLDLDDYRFCKGFIYLTDVDQNSGPHCYIPETHKFDTILEAYSNASDKDEYINWYTETLRKTDEDCRHYLNRDFENITGKRGSRLMVDTSGIHKGLLPVEGKRLILQFLYAQTAYTHSPVELIPFSSFITDQPEHIVKHFEHPTVQYALQLFVDFSA